MSCGKPDLPIGSVHVVMRRKSLPSMPSAFTIISSMKLLFPTMKMNMSRIRHAYTFASDIFFMPLAAPDMEVSVYIIVTPSSTPTVSPKELLMPIKSAMVAAMVEPAVPAVMATEPIAENMNRKSTILPNIPLTAFSPTAY